MSTTYIMAEGKGIFEDYRDDLFEALIKVDSDFHKMFRKSNGDDLVVLEDQKKIDEIDEKIVVHFPKFPMELFIKALAFMGWAYEEHKTEAMVLFKLRPRPEGEERLSSDWSLVIPEQWNGMAAVCYHAEMHPEEMMGVVGDVHSHPKFASSAHSQTDNLDARTNSGIFLVVKDFDLWTCDPTIRGVIRDKSFTVAPSLFFAKSYQAPDPKAPAFPEEWKKRLHTAPCEACRKSKEASEKAKTAQEMKDAYELEKKKKLMPKRLLDAWRKEAKETYGFFFVSSWEAWDKKAHYDQCPIKCDNFSCGEYIRNVECPKCKKSIYAKALITCLGDMVDEIAAMEWAGGDLKKLEDLAIDQAREASQNTTASTSEKDHDTKRIVQVPEEMELPLDLGDEDDKDAFVVLSGEEACNADCTYKTRSIPHRHTLTDRKPTQKCGDTMCAGMGHLFFNCPERKQGSQLVMPSPYCAENCALKGKEHTHLEVEDWGD
jgi:hypothetical protein